MSVSAQVLTRCNSHEAGRVLVRFADTALGEIVNAVKGGCHRHWVQESFQE